MRIHLGGKAQPGKNLALESRLGGVLVIMVVFRFTFVGMAMTRRMILVLARLIVTLARLRLVTAIVTAIGISQVRVLCRKEMPAEPINPILWRSKKIFRAFLFAVPGVRVFGDVFLFEALLAVVDRRVITVVKIGVGLREKMAGEHPATVAQRHLNHVVRLSPASRPRLEPRLHCRSEAEDDQPQQEDRKQISAHGGIS